MTFLLLLESPAGPAPSPRGPRPADRRVAIAALAAQAAVAHRRSTRASAA